MQLQKQTPIDRSLSRRARFMAFLRRHRLEVIILSVVVVLGVGSLVYLYIVQQGLKPTAFQPPAKKAAVKKVEAPKIFSPLTGVAVADEAATKRQVTAIMIENSPSSRPQSGLYGAGVVYEAIAEGGITRFLCLYQESRPGLIGPVRSLRPYYVSWLASFDAAVAHVGGSANALKEVRNGSYKDIDQFFNGSYYWRATDRYAPHNVYTNFDKLDALNQKKGFTSSTFTGFPRKDDQWRPAASRTASKVDIPISSATYNVHYDYDSDNNAYARSVGGKAHLDREAGQIRAKTVIAIKVPVQLGFEDGYREQMQVIGSGPAYIFQDGIVTEGTWSKPAQRTTMTFTDATGKPIALNRGPTWISVIAPEKTVGWQ